MGGAGGCPAGSLIQMTDCREQHGEGTALARCAHHGEFAAVLAHDVADDSHTEPRAGDGRLPSRLRAVELVEQLRLLLFRQTDTRVGDAEVDAVRDESHRERDRSTRTVVLDRIALEVVDDLPDAQRVSIGDRGRGDF